MTTSVRQTAHISPIARLRWSLEQRGLKGTLGVILARFSSQEKRQRREQEKAAIHPFDLDHGVDTSGMIAGARLISGHKHDVHNTSYWGVAPSRARRVLRRWEESLPATAKIEDYTFMDVGCGKGRMVLLASELPFKEVIGVELNSSLAETAKSNANLWMSAGKGRAPIRIIEQDAAELDVPEGRCLVYLYNPFGAPVMRKMLERFEEKFAERKGDLDVVYLYPQQDALFAERKEYELMWRDVILESPEDVAVDPVSTGEHLCTAYRR